MDQETLLELIEKNTNGKIIDVDLPDLTNDPAVIRMREECEKYWRPECFPPELKHLMPDEYKQEDPGK